MSAAVSGKGMQDWQLHLSVIIAAYFRDINLVITFTPRFVIYQSYKCENASLFFQ
jgi:hypothetical protein